MLQNFKVGPRLGMGFGSLVLLMAGIAFLGLRGMSETRDRMEEIVGTNVYKMELINEMSNTVEQVFGILRNIILLDELDAIRDEKIKFDTARGVYNRASEALEKVPAGEQAKIIRAKIKDASIASRSINNKIIELATQNRDDEARRILMSEATQKVGVWQDALKEGVSFQKSNNKDAVEQAVRNYDETRVMILGIVGVALVLAIFVAVLVARSITRPLADTVRVSGLLAQGDLAARVTVNGKDEVAEVGRSINGFLDALETGVPGDQRRGDAGGPVGGTTERGLAKHGLDVGGTVLGGGGGDVVGGRDRFPGQGQHRRRQHGQPAGDGVPRRRPPKGKRR